MKKLIVYGTGLVAEVAAFYFAKDSEYEVVAFANDSVFIKEETFAGFPVIPFEGLEKVHPPSEYAMFIALGYAKTNQIRQLRYAEAQEKGYACASYISSRAAYYGTPVGSNCFILENNVVQPYVQIGNNVTLWSGNHVGHHSRLGNNCFISSQVVISGGCSIGDNCFIGVNATLNDNITLGNFVVVGSGAVVSKNCIDRTVVQSAESSYRVIARDII
jgi:sugar O-acyltransferase (sialic acid O-acetyltransferase NeuD family)